MLPLRTAFAWAWLLPSASAHGHPSLSTFPSAARRIVTPPRRRPPSADPLRGDVDLLLRLRGGEVVERAADAITLELTPEHVLPIAGASLLAAFTVALVRTVPRSGGRAPEAAASFLGKLGVGELGATGLFHLAYFLHCLVVICVMPLGLREAVFSPSGVMLLGTIFPLVESIRAAASGDTDGDKVARTWLMYWIMHGAFSFASSDMSGMIERFGPKGGRHWYGELHPRMLCNF